MSWLHLLEGISEEGIRRGEIVHKKIAKGWSKDRIFNWLTRHPKTITYPTKDFENDWKIWQKWWEKQSGMRYLKKNKEIAEEHYAPSMMSMKKKYYTICRIEYFIPPEERKKGKIGRPRKYGEPKYVTVAHSKVKRKDGKGYRMLTRKEIERMARKKALKTSEDLDIIKIIPEGGVYRA